MGYFSNGTEGEMYEAEWCARCYHMRQRDAKAVAQGLGYRSCPVVDAHLLHNYEECNNARSILHRMIPKFDKPPWNGECVFFDKTDDLDDRKPPIPPLGEVTTYHRDGTVTREIENALGEWEQIEEIHDAL